MNYKEYNRKTYDKIADDYAYRNYSNNWINAAEFEIFKKNIAGKKVIDIGCGVGRDAGMFLESGFDYTGVDLSEGMLKVARQRQPKANFKQMDYYRLNFPGKTFAGFWASASLLHVPKKDIDKVLSAIKKITNDKAVGFISLKEMKTLSQGVIKENKYGGARRYFAFYAKKEFDEILRRNGFEIINFKKKPEDDELKTVWLCYIVRKYENN